VILQQPQSFTASPYGSAAFSVIAAGLPSPAYQWMSNGTPLAGQTAPIIWVHNVQTNAAGSYSVIVSNSGGAIESAAAVLSVADTNPVPILTALPPTNASNVPFILRGEPGRWYLFEITDDLVNWYDYWAWSRQATNTSNTFSVLRINPGKEFIRASLNAAADACTAQLKGMTAARDLYAIENRLSPIAVYDLNNLAPYLPGATNPFCPQHGAYSQGSSITNPPACSLSSVGHHFP